MADAHDMVKVILKHCRHQITCLRRARRVLLNLVYGLIGCGMPMIGFAHDGVVNFVPNWEDDWHFRGRNGQCELHAHIRDAGEVRFTARSRQRLAFEFQAHRDLFSHEPEPTVVSAGARSPQQNARSMIDVVRITPPWHPQPEPARHALGQAMHVAGGGAIARTNLAQQMLWALRSGYYLELHDSAAFDQHTDIRVMVPAQSIQPALERFLRCAQTSVSVAWDEVSRTRVTYPVDRHVVRQRFESRLQDVVRYALIDPDVRKIYVDGHADASGEQRHNTMLSKRRADGVAAFVRRALHELATDAQSKQRAAALQVVVRYHGARYPAAKNTTTQGKARNRRTTVRLERVGEVLAAR